jgi:CubicO group peptidase (beta-lactamase class C family)
MKENIFNPLGIDDDDLAFQISEHSKMQERLVDISGRNESGELIPNLPSYYESLKVKDDAGGGGLYGTSEAYARVLAALLRDDSALLKPATLKEMCEPQLSDSKYLKQWMSRNAKVQLGATNGLTLDNNLNHGLAGLLTLDGGQDRRGPGSLSWGGAANCFWVSSRLFISSLKSYFLVGGCD